MTPESTATALEALLEDLANLGDNAGMTSIAREIRNERLPALREGRMSMVVLGEFNHGKSTAINALLGGDVLPTGITPTTAVI
ncbi:MAG: ribosome biogenesis GTPase A, partial [Bradymonadia bacterium]